MKNSFLFFEAKLNTNGIIDIRRINETSDIIKKII
jgi:hypothetical protein